MTVSALTEYVLWTTMNKESELNLKITYSNNIMEENMTNGMDIN